MWLTPAESNRRRSHRRNSRGPVWGLAVCEVTVFLLRRRYVGPTMARIPPWHSIRQRDGSVYHDDDECPVGGKIELKFRKLGHRCRAQCRACAKLRAPAVTAKRTAMLTPH